MFKVLTAIFTVILLFFQFCLDMLGRFQLAYTFFIILVFVGVLVSFFVIFYLMQKYHDFEFRQNRKPMMVFMLTVAIAAFVDAFILYLDSVIANFDTIETYVMACADTQSLNPMIALQITCLLFPLTNPQYLLCCVALIIYKKTDDILQGVSKLDYLLKVSVFQKYKDKELENRKFTIMTTNNDMDINLSVTSEDLNLRLTSIINESEE